MKRVALALLFLSSPALAEDDEPCFELGGQGIAPCATPKGRVAVESNLLDWQREGDGADRVDTLTLTSTLVRIGIGSNTELRVSGSPMILTQAVGDRWRGSFGDVTVGAKHQFGKDSPIGFALEATLPTGDDPAGQATWSVQATLPMQFKLNDVFTLDATAVAAAAANGDGSGRHFAWSAVVGSDIALSDKVTLTADVKRLRDDDPTEPTTQTSGSLSLGWQFGKEAQLTVGGVAGFDHDAPKAEAYFGVGVRF